MVERAEFEKLRDAVEHADEVQQPDPFAEAAEHQEERDQARLKGQAQAELKRATETVDASAGEAKQKGDELARDAKQAADKGKKEAKEAFAEGKKEAKDLAGKLEREGKAEVCCDQTDCFCLRARPRGRVTDIVLLPVRRRSCSARRAKSSARAATSQSATRRLPLASSVLVRPDTRL